MTWVQDVVARYILPIVGLPPVVLLAGTSVRDWCLLVLTAPAPAYLPLLFLSTQPCCRAKADGPRAANQVRSL